MIYDNKSPEEFPCHLCGLVGAHFCTGKKENVLGSNNDMKLVTINDQAMKIESLELDVKSLKKEVQHQHDLVKSLCEDWAYTDTEIKKMAAPYLTKFEIEGDSYGVPGAIDIVESLIRQIEELKKQ